jgi:hypothetical protein
MLYGPTRGRAGCRRHICSVQGNGPSCARLRPAKRQSPHHWIARAWEWKMASLCCLPWMRVCSAVMFEN